MSKSPSLRRIQADIRELLMEPSDRYHAAPLENDMFEWHFTIRGAQDTDFEGGFYHGRILLPPEYPFKPPNIIFLTPSGRFETGVKVCLSFSAYHPELWQPAWGIRLILEALVSFLPSPADGAIGALDWKPEERKRLAKKSVDYCCPVCGKCSNILLDIEKKLKGRKVNESSKQKFEKDIEKLHALQAAMEGPKEEKKEKKESEIVAQTEEIVDEIEKEADEKCSSDVVQDAESPNSQEEVETVQEDTTKDVLVDVINDVQVETVTTKDESSLNVDAIDEQHLENVSTEDELASPILSDPMANLGIVIFSIVVYLLIRKMKALIDDLLQLEAQFKDQQN
jgi:ubiquitin-conjugating enzyme E2 J1